MIHPRPENPEAAKQKTTVFTVVFCVLDDEIDGKRNSSVYEQMAAYAVICQRVVFR